MRRTIWFLAPVLVFAQTNYVLKTDLLSAGGDTMAAPVSVNYQLFGGSISQTVIGTTQNWNGNYQAIIGFWHPPYGAEHIPPEVPNLIIVEKVGGDARLIWNAVTTDTLGDPENVYYYVVYRDTSPDFIPGVSDSVGFTAFDDTTFIDPGAVDSVNDFYYLVKAVDQALNRSDPSNMGYKFRQVLYENPDRTDKNWISIPYKSPYDSASDLYADIGTDVCQGVTKRDPQTQACTTCIYLGGIWLNNFEIESGQMYEVVVSVDSAVRITGAHDPDLSVLLNENPDRTDKNWISIPYNADYDSVSDIYAHIGTDVCEGVTKRDPQTQAYTTCIYLGGIWLNNFEIERGPGYEIVVNQDTSIRPRIFSNKGGFFRRMIAQNDVQAVLVRKEMSLIIAPEWDVRQRVVNHRTGFLSTPQFQGGEAHICFGWIPNPGHKKIHFRSYITSRPDEVLTEKTYGSGVRNHGDSTVFWVEPGNLYSPWADKERLIVLFWAESLASEDADFIYLVPYGYAALTLDWTENRQSFSSFVPVPRFVLNRDLVGFSRYRIVNGDLRRLTERLISSDDHLRQPVSATRTPGKDGPVITGYVFEGGRELRLSKVKRTKPAVQGGEGFPIRFAYEFKPTLVHKEAVITYALPKRSRVSILIYDPTGRKVRSLVSGIKDPGYYRLVFKGDDDYGRPLSGGVYFCRIKAGDHIQTKKIVLVR